MKKKIGYALLCLIVCVMFISATVFAEEETPTVPSTDWSDYAADSFAGGTGT